MCGPKFCSVRISHDIRNWAAEHCLGVEEANTVGLEQLAIEFCSAGATSIHRYPDAGADSARDAAPKKQDRVSPGHHDRPSKRPQAGMKIRLVIRDLCLWAPALCSRSPLATRHFGLLAVELGT